MSALPSGGATEDKLEKAQAKAIARFLSCVLSGSRMRYYPFKGSARVRARDPRTGRFAREPRHLDPIATWHEKGTTFVLLAEPTTGDGALALDTQPMAVASVPTAAMSRAVPGESTELDVVFQYRWGPLAERRFVPAVVSRSQAFVHRLESAREMPFFTERPREPRASLVSFRLYLVWECEEHFKRAMDLGLTREQVSERVDQQIEAEKERRLEQGPPPVGEPSAPR